MHWRKGPGRRGRGRTAYGSRGSATRVEIGRFSSAGRATAPYVWVAAKKERDAKPRRRHQTSQKYATMLPMEVLTLVVRMQSQHYPSLVTAMLLRTR